MPHAIVPRKLNLAEWLVKLEKRIRRLEVNRTGAPLAGTAGYDVSFDGDGVSGWTRTSAAPPRHRLTRSA